MGVFDNLNKRADLYKRTEELIEKVYYLNNLPWVIGYSGGKDSTCTTQLIINTIIKMKKEGKILKKHVYVISSDTLVENPMIVSTIHDTIKSINSLSQKKNIPISAHIIRPEYSNSFWSNLIGRGYPCPNQTFRWCTDRMKINPANDFIMNIVSKYGEAIMVLGVRDGESESRDRVLETHTIEGRELMRHTTMPNAYVFAPIRNFTVDDVWGYLLSNKSPWGSDNTELFNLYKESSEDCPLIIDNETKQNHTCGNSRFGCWVCTVVSKDKSLTSFINKGEDWLISLLKYRNWLYSIRDDETYRMRRRQDGSIYFSKISKTANDELIIPMKGDKKKIILHFEKNKLVEDNGTEWIYFDGVNSEEDAKRYISSKNINLNNGDNPHIIIKKIDGSYAQLGPGPFTIKARKEMLKKLLLLQKEVGEKVQLIKKEELLEIRKLWFKYGIWDDEVSKIYFSVFGEELDLVKDDIVLFDDLDLEILKNICEENNYSTELIKNIFSEEKKYMGYNNRQEVNKFIKKALSQEFLHLNNGMGDTNDN